MSLNFPGQRPLFGIGRIHKSKHDFSLATEIPARLRVYSGHPGEHFEDLQVLRCGEMFEIIHGVAYHIGFPDTASID